MYHENRRGRAKIKESKSISLNQLDEHNIKGKQAHKTGAKIFVWCSQTYKNMSRYLNKSLASINSTNDTIRRSKKSYMYSCFDSLKSKKKNHKIG